MDRRTDVHRRRSRRSEPRCVLIIQTFRHATSSFTKGGLPRSRQEPEITKQGGLIKTRRALNAGQPLTARWVHGNPMESNSSEAARAAVAASLILAKGFFAGRSDIAEVRGCGTCLRDVPFWGRWSCVLHGYCSGMASAYKCVEGAEFTNGDRCAFSATMMLSRLHSQSESAAC